MIGFKICKASSLSFRNWATDLQCKSLEFFLRARKFGANPFQPSVAFHIETSYMICKTNQVTGSL